MRYETKNLPILPVSEGNFIEGSYKYGTIKGVVVKVFSNKVEIKPIESVGFVRDNTARILNETVCVTRSRIREVHNCITEYDINIVD